MGWTQEQIKAERDRLMNELADANTEVAVVRAKLRGLTARCKHPDAYEYSAMGERGIKCPDCGRAT